MAELSVALSIHMTQSSKFLLWFVSLSDFLDIYSELSQPLLASESRRIHLVDSRIKDCIDGEQLRGGAQKKKAWLGHQSSKS